MKKIFYLLTAIVILATSCQKEDNSKKYGAVYLEFALDSTKLNLCFPQKLGAKDVVSYNLGKMYIGGNTYDLVSNTNQDKRISILFLQNGEVIKSVGCTASLEIDQTQPFTLYTTTPFRLDPGAYSIAIESDTVIIHPQVKLNSENIIEVI